MATEQSKHRWVFFRSGGVEQVSLDAGADLAALESLDQKLWVALSCPTTGIVFDAATLAMIDTDHDGRIRPPELLAAVKWACSVLKTPDVLLQRSDKLALDAIDGSSEQGRALLASAKQILVNLGKSDAKELSLADVADTEKIFAETRFNGDGVVTVETADDAAVKAAIEEIIACLGAETDRSGKPGVNQVKVDQFFTEAEAYAGWWKKSEDDAAILPLGAATAAAAAAVGAVRAKVEDYFARCRLAAFDPRALEAIANEEQEHLALAAKDLKITPEEIAHLPLARVEGGKPLPLAQRVNPAWAEALARFADDAVIPLTHKGSELAEEQWEKIVATLQPYEAWLAEKAGVAVEKLGIERVRAILQSSARAQLNELITQDKAFEAEANHIAEVHKLVLFQRDLDRLLNNYVSFRDFYGRKDKAIFQAGTLYLDRRSCDLCIRVEDVAKHASLGVSSRSLLAYCDLARKATGEKMSIVAAFTGGDADYLFVGRNGVFYDREGRDWDATVVKLIDNPVSVRQAIWAPYKKFLKLVENQIEKFAAAKDKAVQESAAANVASAGDAAAAAPAAGPAAPPAAAAAKKDAFDVAKFAGIFAAIGLAIGAIGGVLGAMFGAFMKLAWWQMPLAILGIMVAISGPSVIIAWLKLRQRNVGPLLDACGWAINSQAKINIPFGATLTHLARLPAGAKHRMADAYRQRSRAPWLIVLLVLLALAGLWYFGVIERYVPGILPTSGWVEQKLKERAAPAPAQVAPAPKAGS